jgi:hypothetical protein
VNYVLTEAEEPEENKTYYKRLDSDGKQYYKIEEKDLPINFKGKFYYELNE